MRDKSAAPINFLAILNIIIISIFYTYQFAFNWPLLKLSGLLGPSRFIDLVAIQDFSKCVGKYGVEVYEISNHCSGYQYSLGVLYLFDYSGFSSLSGIAAALLLEIPLLLSMILLVAFSFKKSKKIGMFSVLAVLAPGNWLLLERGNLDLIMVQLLVVAALTFRKKKEYFGFIMLMITIFTKFYTAPIMILYILYGQKKLRKYFYIPATLVVILASVFQIKQVAKFPSTWYVSYGSGSIGHWVNLFMEHQINSSFRFSDKIGLIIGVLILCVSVTLHWKGLRNFNVPDANLASSKENVILFLGFTFIACYVVGMNYDYRMIFAIIVCTLILTEEESTPCRFYFVLISLGSFYFSSFFYGQTGMSVIYQQLIGDIFLGLLVSYLCVYFLHKYRTIIMELVSKCKNQLSR